LFINFLTNVKFKSLDLHSDKKYIHSFDDVFLYKNEKFEKNYHFIFLKTVNAKDDVYIDYKIYPIK